MQLRSDILLFLVILSGANAQSKNLKNSTSNALDSIKMHSPVGVDFPENGENVYEIDKRGAPCKRSGDRISGG